MVRSTGEIDYGTATRALDAEFGWSRRKSLLLVHRSMAGGLLSIARSRNYLRNTLLGRLPDVGLDDPEPGTDRIHVAVHVRLGDSENTIGAGPGPRDTNERLPAAWYRSVLSALRERFGPCCTSRSRVTTGSASRRCFPSGAGHGQVMARPRGTLHARGLRLRRAVHLVPPPSGRVRRIPEHPGVQAGTADGYDGGEYQAGTAGGVAIRVSMRRRSADLIHLGSSRSEFDRSVMNSPDGY